MFCQTKFINIIDNNDQICYHIVLYIVILQKYFPVNRIGGRKANSFS